MNTPTDGRATSSSVRRVYTSLSAVAHRLDLNSAHTVWMSALSGLAFADVGKTFRSAVLKHFTAMGVAALDAVILTHPVSR